MDVKYLLAITTGFFMVDAYGMEVVTVWNKRPMQIVNQTMLTLKVRTRQEFNVPDQAEVMPPISRWVTLLPAKTVELKYLSSYLDRRSGSEVREFFHLAVDAKLVDDRDTERIVSLNVVPLEASGYHNQVVAKTITNGILALEAFTIYKKIKN